MDRSRASSGSALSTIRSDRIAENATFGPFGAGRLSVDADAVGEDVAGPQVRATSARATPRPARPASPAPSTFAATSFCSGSAEPEDADRSIA